MPKKKIVKSNQNLEEQNDGNPQRIYEFNPDWINPKSKEYKWWVTKSDMAKNHYFCILCEKHLTINTIWGNHSYATTHEHDCNLKHKMGMVTSNIQNVKSSPKSVSLQEKVLEFEIELTQFIVDNHLSFLIGEKMIKFMKKYCDYEVVTAASLNDEKISRIIRECVKPILVNTLNEKLANVLFSLSCDETTHMASNKKYFAIMIQFYDEKLTKLRSYLHTFEATKKSDSDSLYQVLANHVLEKNIGNNVIGISMDNASINKGSKNSISTHIQAKYPYVWVNYCICI